MNLVMLTKDQFDKFSYSHPLHSYYQTSMYANIMKSCNYEVYYFGFTDNENNLVGATMMLSQTIIGSYKYAYAPRGFLINYDNKELIKEVTSLLKKYLSKKKYIFLKIDPLVINNKRDKDGNIIPSPFNNDVTQYLKSIGYNYYGENKFFGTLKPRWNAILKVTGSSNTLFKNFDDQIRNKIRKAESRGVEIIKGNHNDIKLFYTFVAKKHSRTLEYYQTFAKEFGDDFEIYFAKLNSEKYLQNIKKLYELEVTNNEKINLEIQEKSMENKITNKLMNTKITSDKLLDTYKKELIFASDLFAKNPSGVIIGATAIILDKNGVELLIEGQNPEYALYYPNYLTKWYIIEKYAKKGAVYFDLNAITGYFADDSKYKGLNEMKLGYGAEVTEYIGEFDLVIKENSYKLYCKSKLFRNLIKRKTK